MGLKGLTPRRAAGLVAASVLAYALTLLGGGGAAWAPRFTFEPMNYWFTAAANFAVPLSLAAFALAIEGVWRKAIACVLAAMLALPLVPFGLFAWLESTNVRAGDDPSFKRLSEVQAGGRAHRLYLTNCGATCAFGLELREEIEFLGVLKLVSTEWSSYRAPTDVPNQLRLSPESKVQVVRGDFVVHTMGEDDCDRPEGDERFHCAASNGRPGE